VVLSPQHSGAGSWNLRQLRFWAMVVGQELSYYCIYTEDASGSWADIQA
jgi:hypothetical protein